MNTFTNI